MSDIGALLNVIENRATYQESHSEDQAPLSIAEYREMREAIAALRERAEKAEGQVVANGIAINEIRDDAERRMRVRAERIADLEAQVERLDEDGVFELKQSYERYVNHNQELREQVERLTRERDDAISGLRYIAHRYGKLEGVGWNRLGIQTLGNPQERTV